MSVWTGISILLGVPVAGLLAGAWLGPRLGLASASQRVAACLLGGLGVLLFTLSLVNLVLPLRGWALLLVVAPVLASVARPADLRALAADLRTMLLSLSGVAFVASAALFLALLLWPAFADEHVMFYDGTANHDAFFWITGADHLQRHSYLARPAPEALQPAMHYVSAISGWLPLWGRMGAEGYLASVAGLAHVTPLAAYLWASAALFTAWIAAVYLVVRTFLTNQLHWPAAAALALFQPLFAFYHHNANLPNLLGMLAGATLVVATEQVCRTAPRGEPAAWAWAALSALAWHGLLCSYPEMAPFIALPCGLLALRAANHQNGRAAARWVAGACVVALLANPATTIRAVHGFVSSVTAARTADIWSNFLSASGPGEFLPALLTLSAKFGRELGDTGGTLLTVALLAVIVSTWWRARDRAGMTCLFAGAGALALYTAITGFSYGWQKTIQFSGVFIAALLPVAAVEQPVARAPRRLRGYLAAALLFAVFIYVAVMVQLDLLKWSGRKALSDDWSRLNDAAASATAERPIAIDAATFRYAFFHGMWAAYFLPGQPVVYATRGEQNGGYLRLVVQREVEGRPPAAVLVSREWADDFEPDAPRLATGREFALLAHATRVSAIEGTVPTNGVPRAAGPEVSLTLVPRAAGFLVVEIGACDDVEVRGYWRALIEREGAAPTELTLAGSNGPWRGSLPLAEGARHTVRLRFVPSFGTRTPKAATFPLEKLRIVTSPR